MRDSLIQFVRGVAREEAGGKGESACTRNKEASKVREEKRTWGGGRDDKTQEGWDSKRDKPAETSARTQGHPDLGIVQLL